MDREDVVRIYKVILLSHKKDETLPSATTWMQLEIIILSEISQKEKDKYHIYIIYKGNLKYDTNEPICKTETDPQT